MPSCWTSASNRPNSSSLTTAPQQQLPNSNSSTTAPQQQLMAGPYTWPPKYLAGGKKQSSLSRTNHGRCRGRTMDDAEDEPWSLSRTNHGHCRGPTVVVVEDAPWLCLFVVVVVVGVFFSSWLSVIQTHEKLSDRNFASAEFFPPKRFSSENVCVRNFFVRKKFV